MISSDQREKERRLLELLYGTLDAYDARAIAFEALLGRVQNVIDELDGLAEPSRVARLRNAWGQLEILWAFALDEGRWTLTPEEQGEVRESVAEMRALLSEFE
jgi:hypothetical protein